MHVIPQTLTPDYVALCGREWPLSAAATFRIAMWLTKAERQKLPRWRKHRWASVFALEPPALAGGHCDGDIDERHRRATDD